MNPAKHCALILALLADSAYAGNGSIVLSSSHYAADGGSGSVVIEVLRNPASATQPNRGCVSVDYATYDGTATAGVDYKPTTGTLYWGYFDSTPKSFSVPLLPGNSDGQRSFGVNLSNVGTHCPRRTT